MSQVARQCVYNVTQWRLHVTIVAVETQKYVVRVLLRRHCQQYKNTGCCTTVLLWRIYIAGLGTRVKCLLILAKFGYSQQTFIKVTTAKFQEYPSSGCRGDTGGRIDMQTYGLHACIPNSMQQSLLRS